MSYMLEYRSTRVPLQELLKEFLYIFLINVRWSWLNRKCFKTTKYDNVHFTRQLCPYGRYIHGDFLRYNTYLVFCILLLLICV